LADSESKSKTTHIEVPLQEGMAPEGTAQRRMSKTMRIDLPLADAAEAPQLVETKAPSVLPAGVADSTFQDLFQSVYDGAVLTHPNGHIIDANSRACSLVGYSRDELRHAGVGDLVSGIDAEFLANVWETLSSDRFVLLQAWCVRRSSDIFPVEVSVNRLALGEGDYLCWFIRDVTMRRETEERLRTGIKALDNAGNGVATCTLDGLLEYVNPATAALWGCEHAEEMHGWPVRGLFVDPDRVDTALARVLAGEAWRGEVEGRHADGEAFFVDMAVSANYDAEGEMTGAVLSFVDVTARRRAEEVLDGYREKLESLVEERTAALEQSNIDLQNEIKERIGTEHQLREAVARLKEHDRARAEFVSNVSHELRTPLAALQYALDNLRKGVLGEMPERIVPYLEMMHEDCLRLGRTVSDILDLSRIEENRLVLNRMVVPFSSLVGGATGMLATTAAEKPVELVVQAPEATGFVECDPDKVERVIANIVGNAIKFTPEGGRVEVSVAANVAGDGQAVVRVKDTGCGIPAEYIDRVTERYFRIGEHVTGSGLGLAIAKEIVEMHEGSLVIESPATGAGSGTTVTVHLPLCDPLKILVAAGDEAVREMLAGGLQSRGFQVVTANDGSAALQMARGETPAAIVMDVHLPGRDGQEVLLHLKGDRIAREIPVMMVACEDVELGKRRVFKECGVPLFEHLSDAARVVSCVESTFLGRQSE